MFELASHTGFIDGYEHLVESSKIRQVSISEIRVSGLNDEIYKQVDPDDPAIAELAVYEKCGQNMTNLRGSNVTE